MPGWRADLRPAWKRGVTLTVVLSVWAAIAAAPACAATSVSLTFDDGQASQYALKGDLASRGMHATFFLNSAKMGTSSFYMTWAQATALAADGNEIGGHTLSHADLSSLSDAQRRTEVCNDRQSLISHGFDPVSFAYPFGGGDASVQAIVSECGYKSGRRVGGIVSPNWCPSCGSPHAESIPPENPFDVRTPAFGNGEITLAAMQTEIMEAEISGGGWVPFVFHGVCDNACNEGWVRQSTIAALLDWLAPRTAQGTSVRTMRQVIEHQAPNTSIGSKPAATTAATSASFTFSSSPTGAAFDCSLDGATFAPCTGPAGYSGLADGSHTFQVRARDAFGAVDVSPASWTWTVDATPPDTSITSGPSGSVSSTSASFGFSSTESGTFECKLDAGGWASCTSPKAYSGLDQGSHTFSVRGVDALGNADGTPASRTWVVDTVAPDTSITSGPSGTVASTSASFAFAAPGAVSFECKLDSGAWGVCTSPRDLSSLGQGAHTFSVRGIDLAGNVDATPASRTWTVDTIAPDTGITGGPTGAVATASASFPFSSTEPGTFECKLDSSDWESCSSPKAYSGLGDGAHTFSVRGIDAVGNVDATPASRTWTVDTTPPVTSISSGPAGAVSSTSASFAFAAPGAASFECKLDGGNWASCTTPKSYSGLAQGSHTFSVRGIDAVGNTDPTPASRTWTVDTVAPETSITAGPSGAVSSASASLVFSSSEPGTFECKLDSEDWGACTSPESLTGLGEGSHTFSVRATDTAGNTDPTPATRTWTVDTVPPETSISSGPAGSVSSTSASFAFAAPGAASFECKLDSGAWDVCSSPKAYSGLAQGSHTFSVRGIDAVGNTDPTPASRTWTVDTVAPDTSLTGGPTGAVATASASFPFSSTEPGTFECKLDAGDWESCSSPKAYAGLADGNHTFSVRGIDAVGNVDATPASRTWTVDTTPPVTSISSGPSGTVASASASFAFAAPGAASFECKLDSGAWDVCSSPKSYSGLGDGAHTFSVRGIDAVGNVDASPASRTWTVDTTPPETSISSGPSAPVSSTAASFAFTAAGATSFECKLDTGAWESCSSPKAYTGLADGDHTFSVRGIDAVGNTDPSPASRSWTVDTTSPETSIGTGPSGTVASASASFTFDAAPPADSFECKLDGSEWAACTSPVAYSGLADGDHTFSVRSADAVGNIDPTPDARTWKIDTTAPNSTITSGPSDTVRSGAASFGFRSTEPGAFECRLDGGAWEACSSPKAYSDLASGSHAFSVRATDTVGNVEGSPAKRDWTVAPPERAPESEEPPAGEQPETGSTGDDRSSADDRSSGGDWAQAYLKRLLRATARAYKHKKLRAFARGRRMRVRLPAADRGELQIRLSLLPSNAGPAVRLARGRADAAKRRQLLKLKLGKKARKRLRRLYVAAFELNATLTPAGGDTVYARRVFKLRR